MTTSHDLPIEILHLIFEKLPYYLVEIQKVCREWYPPAHTQLLKEVSLSGSQQIEKFIRSIESNPKPSYLGAVKIIRLDITDDDPLFKKTRFKKVFFRFPNLERVYIADSKCLFKVLDDRLCENFWKSCPKVTKFRVDVYHYDHTRYCKLLHKARQLVTTLEIPRFSGGVSHFGGVLKFVSSFPRLRRIGGSIPVDNFQQILPAFKLWPNVNKFGIECEQDDNMDSLEMMVQEEPQLLERLSKIYYLELYFDNGICLNTITFISKYMKDLTEFHLHGKLDRNWSDIEQTQFCSHVLDLFLSSKKRSSIYLNLRLDLLKEYLPVFTRRLSSTSTKSILKIIFSEKRRASNNTEFAIRKEGDGLEHIITVWISSELDLQDLATSLFKENGVITDVDKFEVDMDSRAGLFYSHKKADVDMYDRVVRAVPSKEVLLGIPVSFEEKESTCTDIYPQTEKLVLCATAKARFQTLLDRCALAFPNLRQLEIYYYSGVLNEATNEFELKLDNYAVESLMFDMTPVDTKSESTLDKLVIKVTTLADNECCLYLTSINEKSVTRIQDADLEGKTRGLDYYQVHMTISSLQQLEICLDRGPYAYMEFLLPAYFSKRIISNVIFDKRV